MSPIAIRRALISVSNKDGIVEFCQELERYGVELLSTGGSAHLLREAGIQVKDISDYTGFPEMMAGRLKTLHPKVHGGLLALRDDSEHQSAAQEHGIEMIDLVVVNLYPFEEKTQAAAITWQEAIEQIDIGGPTMLRSAAKNHAFVAVVCDQKDYPAIINELHEQEGSLSLETRTKLARKVFQRTASYDKAIAQWLMEHDPDNEDKRESGQKSEPLFEEELTKRFQRKSILRYGENPHQSGALYADPAYQGPSLVGAQQVSGKELSYNNLLDVDAGLRLVLEFESPAAVVIKHTNACGCAEASSLEEAYKKAQAGDPLSAFGGILALNRTCDQALAQAILDQDTFLEAIIAPAFSPEALRLITEENPRKWRSSVRLLSLESPQETNSSKVFESRSVLGGLLVQEQDSYKLQSHELQNMSKAQVADDLVEELLFAWKIVKHLKSNAICITSNKQLLGIGSGQTSRVDAVTMAIQKAGDRAHGAVLASDAFFPFPDSIERASEAGIQAIIQPGGSVRDQQVVAACDQANIALVHTGIRHFKH